MAQIKLRIYKNTRTTKQGKEFTVFSTQMMLPVIENGVKSKPQKKSVNVRFVDDAEIKAKKISNGTIYLLDDMIQVPSVWKITKDSTNNKDVYPVCYIHDFIKFEKYQRSVSQSMFVVDDEKELDPYTIPDELPFDEDINQ